MTIKQTRSVKHNSKKVRRYAFLEDHSYHLGMEDHSCHFGESREETTFPLVPSLVLSLSRLSVYVFVRRDLCHFDGGWTLCVRDVSSCLSEDKCLSLWVCQCDWLSVSVRLSVTIFVRVILCVYVWMRLRWLIICLCSGHGCTWVSVCLSLCVPVCHCMWFWSSAVWLPINCLSEFVCVSDRCISPGFFHKILSIVRQNFVQ